MENEKKLYQKWWFWSIIIVIICIIIIVNVINKSIKIRSEGISIEEYQSIKNGMTMTEVSKIINPENFDNILSEQISRIEDITGSVIYKYKYIGEHKGYAIITYEYTTEDLWSGKGMKVILKEKFDLE